MLLQRAIAAASQGDLWYLSRLLYDGLGVDPETQQADPRPELLRRAVLRGRMSRLRTAGRHARGPGDDVPQGGPRPRYGDGHPGRHLLRRPALCVLAGAAGRRRAGPRHLADVPYPMFVLGATLDPATPWANAERIAANAGDNAYLIVKPGGPHVIFGRGEACPDDLVTAFLEDGTLPASRRTVCPGDVADDYVPIPPLISTELPVDQGGARVRGRRDHHLGRLPGLGRRAAARDGLPVRWHPSPTRRPTRAATSSSMRAPGRAAWASRARGSSMTTRARFSLKVSQSGADGATVRYRRDAKGRLKVKGDLRHVREPVAGDRDRGRNDGRLGRGGGVDQRRPDGPRGDAAASG